MFFKRLQQFFSTSQPFTSREWLLQQQIFSLQLISFFFGWGVLLFSYVRLTEGNLIVGLAQLLLGLYLIDGFFRLKRNRNYYTLYSSLFMVFFFGYTAIIFFYVPQNHLNILWVISAPILVFFFLNRTGGIMMFIAVGCFILYLIMTGYPYTAAEYITLIAAFLITSFVMLSYERVKDAERYRLLHHAQELQQEVDRQTEELNRLNHLLASRLDEELDKRLVQEQMLLRQCRMASMGEMLDSIAHQWRQPLMHINAILMNIDRVSEGEHREYLDHKIEELSDLTTHMSQTIEDFRGLFKQNKKRQKFNLYSITSEVLKLMENTLKNIELTLRIPRESTIYNYKNEFIQVLIILITNAKEILDQRRIPHPKILLRVSRHTHYTLITVEDNAGGIADTHIERIFDPYYTTKEQSGGTGLGLYISKIIIEHNMGGEITAVNTEQGARFILKIPHTSDDSS